MTNYAKISNSPTPQTTKATGKQIKNQAGGYVFQVDDVARLERFLVLGVPQNTYYASQRKLVTDNTDFIVELIKKDGKYVVLKTVEMSDSGRIVKNDTALFVLCLCMKYGDKSTKEMAYASLNSVARTFTHLAQLASFRKDLGMGNGRGWRRAIARWYQDKSVDQVAYQFLKYPSRHGWTHRDMLRISHPNPQTDEQDALFWWITHGIDHPDKNITKLLPEIVLAKTVTDSLSQVALGEDTPKKKQVAINEIVDKVKHHRLTREMLATDLLNNPDIWDALLASMPTTAMVRNLNKMTNMGILAPGKPGLAHVVSKLNDKSAIEGARMHPVNILTSMMTYDRGHGVKGSLTWKPVPQIVAALQEAFYLSFENRTKITQRIMISIDISGSMGQVPYDQLLSPREICSAIAMTLVRTCPNYIVNGFSGAYDYRNPETRMVNIGINQNMDLATVIKATEALQFGPTDCALPMVHALRESMNVDAFIILTDNETWYGHVHPMEALRFYRKETGIDAKLAVLATLPTKFTIADPDDAGSIDIVGFDSHVPSLLDSFISGNL